MLHYLQLDLCAKTAHRQSATIRVQRDPAETAKSAMYHAEIFTYMADADATVDGERGGDVLIERREVAPGSFVAQLSDAQHSACRDSGNQ